MVNIAGKGAKNNSFNLFLSPLIEGGIGRIILIMVIIIW